MTKNMTKKVSITLLLALCLWGVFGSVASAALPGLVQCGRSTDTNGNAVSAKAQVDSCDFQALLDMINRLITYGIFVATFLAPIAFAYAGWLYLSAGDNPGQVTKARHVFISVAIGFALVLCAWLIFKLIATTFLNSNYVGSTYLK